MADILIDMKPYRPEIGGPLCERDRMDCSGKFCRRHRLECHMWHWIAEKEKFGFVEPGPVSPWTPDEQDVMSHYAWRDYMGAALIDEEKLARLGEGMRKGDRFDEAE